VAFAISRIVVLENPFRWMSRDETLQMWLNFSSKPISVDSNERPFEVFFYQ